MNWAMTMIGQLIGYGLIHLVHLRTSLESLSRLYQVRHLPQSISKNVAEYEL